MPTTEREVALRAVLAHGRTRDLVAGRTRAHPARQYRGADRPRLGSRRSNPCAPADPLSVESSATRLRELGQDGRRGGALLRRHADSPGGYTPHARPRGADPRNPAPDTGRRQRVAVQTGYPVISVSQSMRIISLYLGTRRHVLESSSELLSRANQGIATLERYKARLDEVSNTLSALEIEDLVTVRDATIVLQRLEMVRRIADEIVGYVVELGTDGRLLALQLDELLAGVDADRQLIARDYPPVGRRERSSELVMVELAELSATDLLDLTAVARTLGFGGDAGIARRSDQSPGLPAAVPCAPAARAPLGSRGRAVRRSAEALGGERRGTRGDRRLWGRRGRGRCEKPSPGSRMHQ